MKLTNYALCLSLVLTVCVAGTSFACITCSESNPVNNKKGSDLKGKAVNVYGSFFFSEEQLLLTDDHDTESSGLRAMDFSVNILPSLYYVLNDKIVIKAVYNKFILPVSPDEFITPQPEPSDSVTVGLDFRF